MTTISRRTFLGTLPLLPPIFQQAGAQPKRTFGWVNELPPEKYPEGVRHATFFSSSNKTKVGYCIFLPPNYEAPSNSATRYPVVYALHGGFIGSELLMMPMATRLGQEMREGRVPPAIYVFPNGGRVSHYDYPALGSYGETALVRELIPHVDKTYRTIAGRAARGLEGFSAGGRGTARMMLKHPELFISAVPISGGHQHEKYIQENDGKSQTPPDMVFEPGNNTYDLARLYASRKHDPVNILVVVGTTDPNFEPNLHWMKHLDSLRITHKRILVEGVGHNYPGIAERAGLEIMQFHARNFKSQ